MTFEKKAAYTDADYLNGDPVAFGALVVKYQGGLIGFLGRMGFSQAECEELAQEAFLRVWKNRASYNADKAGLSTWIFTIAKNIALNDIARVVPHTVDEFDLSTLLDKQPETDPATQYESYQTLQRLRHALRSLNPEDRVVIAAKFTPDMAKTDVAELLKCSEGALRTRFSRARQKLANILKELDKTDE